jgi:hypothetical protein
VVVEVTAREVVAVIPSTRKESDPMNSYFRTILTYCSHRSYMVYVQKLSNHLALLIPRTTSATALTIGNEDSAEKKAKDQNIFDIALPEQSDFLCAREPVVNHADAELCGKWKVTPSNKRLIIVPRKVVATLVSRGK